MLKANKLTYKPWYEIVASGRLTIQNNSTCQFNDGRFVASDTSEFLLSSGVLNVNGSGALITGSAHFRSVLNSVISILARNLEMGGAATGFIGSSTAHIRTGDLKLGGSSTLFTDSTNLFISNGNLMVTIFATAF